MADHIIRDSILEEKKSTEQIEVNSEAESGEDLEGSSHDEEEWDLMLHATLSSVLEDGSIPVSIIQSSIKAMSMSSSAPVSFSEDYNDTFALDGDGDGIELSSSHTTHISDYGGCNCDSCLCLNYDYGPEQHYYQSPTNSQGGWSHHRTNKPFNRSGYSSGGYYKKPYKNNNYYYKQYVGNGYRKPRGGYYNANNNNTNNSYYSYGY